MEYLALNNGVRMPLVGFGTWTLRGSEGETCVQNPSCKAVLCTVTDDMARSRKTASRQYARFTRQSLLSNYAVLP